MFQNDRFCLCSSCYHRMEGILDKSIRDVCHDCGGSSLVEDSAPRLAARKIAREEYGMLFYSNLAMR